MVMNQDTREWLSHRFGENVKYDEPMAQHTSFRVGGPVRHFVEPRNWDEVEAVYSRCREAGLRLRTIGRGCNTLVTDGPHEA